MIAQPLTRPCPAAAAAAAHPLLSRLALPLQLCRQSRPAPSSPPPHCSCAASCGSAAGACMRCAAARARSWMRCPRRPPAPPTSSRWTGRAAAA